MMKRISILLVSLLVAVVSFSQSITQQEVNEQLNNLPFQSFKIALPVFPAKTFSIADKGAVGDGVFKNTAVINSTIRECARAGGGRVVIPAGIYLTGAITMASNVNLHLETGAVILFSGNLNDYELVYSSGGKASLPSLINASGLENAAITGDGVINGNGDQWRPIKKEKLNEKEWKALNNKGGEFSPDAKMWFPRKGTLAAIRLKSKVKASAMTKEQWKQVSLTFRPYTMSLENSKNILIEGVTLMNSPHITSMLRGINGLVMNNVKVLNEWWYQNADGLDISRCRNVLMYNCTVNTGDDGICMKSSGRKGGKFALENIVIKDCKVFHAHGGFVIGSNTDGGMNNIYVRNLTCSLTDVGLRFKSDVTRGGKVTNIFIDKVYMTNIKDQAVFFDLTYSDKAAIPVKADDAGYLAPDFDGIHIKNIYCYGAGKACEITGIDQALNVKNVSFENLLIQSDQGFGAVKCAGVSVSNVQILAKEGPAFRLENTKDFSFINMKAAEGKTVKVEGSETSGLTMQTSEMTLSNFDFSNGAKPENVIVK